MTDKSIIRLCEMCFKPTQDDECIHYPDTIHRPIVKYRVIEYTPLTAIKSLIRERRKAIADKPYDKGRPYEDAWSMTVYDELLTHLEEMEK